MKNKILLAVFVSFCIFSTNLSAEDSNSAKHFGLSAVFGYASETYLHHNQKELSNMEKISYATIIGTLPGLAKELNDTKFDNEDLAFDIAGAFAGSLLSNYLNNNVFLSVKHDSERKSTKIAANYKF